MIEISDECMSLMVDDKVVATARFGRRAAAYGNGAWIVSTHPVRLFTRDGAAVTDRLIRLITTPAVVAVAGVAAIISYRHAY